MKSLRQRPLAPKSGERCVPSDETEVAGQLHEVKVRAVCER